MTNIYLREFLDVNDPNSPFMHYITNNIEISKKLSKLLKAEFWKDNLKLIVDSLGIDTLEYISNFSDANAALAYLQTVRDSHNIYTIIAEIDKFHFLNETHRNALIDFAALIYFGLDGKFHANKHGYYSYDEEVLVCKYCSSVILKFVINKFKEIRQVDSRKVKEIQEWLQEPYFDSVEQVLATRDLFNAAWFGDLKSIKAAIAKGANVNYMERKVAPPMLMAVIGGNVAIVEELLKAGADPDAEINYSKDIYPDVVLDQADNNNAMLNVLPKEVKEKVLKRQQEKNNIKIEQSITTPLVLASGIGRYNIVETLIKYGADVNKFAGEKYNTPLNQAIKKERHEITGLLIKHGADIKVINVKNIKGEMNVSPLLILSPTGNLEAMKLILDGGADVNERTIFEATPLIQASMFGHVKVVELLLQYPVEVDAVDKFGKTALIWAVEKGDLNIVEALIAKKVDLDIINNEGMTALMIAALMGLDRIVEVLIKHGADANIESKYWGSALMIAISKSYAKIARIIMPNVLDVDKEFYDGSTALLKAIKVRNEEIVKALLKQGANPNKQNRYLKYPLVVALADTLKNSKSKKEIVKLLLKYNANPYTLTFKNTNCFDKAIEAGDKEIINLLDAWKLENKNTLVNNSTLELEKEITSLEQSHYDEIRTAIESNSIDTIKKLLKQKIRLEVKGKEPLLNIAIGKNSYEIAKLLLDHGINPNIRDEGSGEASVMMAVCRDNVEMIKLLIKYKADLDLFSWSGYTPLMFAVSMNRKETIKLLLEAGANVNYQNYDKETALSLAVQHCYENVAILLKNGADPCLGEIFKRTTLLESAATEGDEEVINLLINNNTFFRGTSIESAIKQAIAKDYGGVIELLINHKDFIILIPQEAGLLLSDAIKNNNNHAVKVLLKYFKKIGFKEEDLRAGLAWAIERGETEIIIELLKAGVDINHINNGTTALIEAVKDNNISTAEAILHYGKSLSINAKDQQGNSALYYAVINNDENIVQLILDKKGTLSDEEINKLNNSDINKASDIMKIMLREDLKQKILGEHSGKIVVL
ncbi:ankyrin repeat domain-containing protein [Candidatus Jidaibacter acanthamoebae]|nr:ankyrin repeat domain-containing protein [Candidatus Jidaibacter acanthamoeba]